MQEICLILLKFNCSVQHHVYNHIRILKDNEATFYYLSIFLHLLLPFELFPLTPYSYPLKGLRQIFYKRDPHLFLLCFRVFRRIKLQPELSIELLLKSLADSQLQKKILMSHLHGVKSKHKLLIRKREPCSLRGKDALQFRKELL